MIILANMKADLKKILEYFGFVMVLVYLAAGIFLLIPAVQFELLGKNTRIAFGLTLLLYGLFRAWKVLKIKQDESDN